MDMSFLSCYYLKKPSCTATFKTTRNVNCFKNKLDFQARSRHVKLANFELAKKVCVLVGKSASIFGHIQFYTIPYILYFKKVPWQFRLAYFAKISGGKEVQRRDQYFCLQQLGIVKNNLCKFVDNTQEEK